MIDNVIAGLTSGLFVSIFVFAFSKFWNAVIIPWFEERVYKDVRIEGKWYSLYAEEMAFRQEVVLIKRHGHFITGNIVCVKGPDEGEEYKISGSFRNLILPLTYENTDRTNTDRGTITLKSNGSGKKMSGKVSYYCSYDDAIDDARIFWFRKKIDLEKALNDMKLDSEERDSVEEENQQKPNKNEETNNLP